MKSNDYNDNSDYSMGYRDGQKDTILFCLQKLEEDIPKEDFKKYLQQIIKPKRTLEELGITEDKYYIVGRKTTNL